MGIKNEEHDFDELYKDHLEHKTDLAHCEYLRLRRDLEAQPRRLSKMAKKKGALRRVKERRATASSPPVQAYLAGQQNAAVSCPDLCL